MLRAAIKTAEGGAVLLLRGHAVCVLQLTASRALKYEAFIALDTQRALSIFRTIDYSLFI